MRHTEAMSLSDRIAILKDGRIAAEGSAAEVYARPDTLFAAEFIGSPKINLFPAVLQKDGEGWRAELAGQTLSLPALTGEMKSGTEQAMSERVPSGRTPEEVILGIRPEQLLTEAEAASANDIIRLRARFRGLARAGAGAQILFAVDGVTGTFSSLSSEGFPEEEGEEIIFLIKKDAVQVFDKNSGKNITRR